LLTFMGKPLFVRALKIRQRILGGLA